MDITKIWRYIKMIADILHVTCTKRCELLLALTTVIDPNNLISIASKLGTDSNRSAIHLAEKLTKLPHNRARELSLKTLADAGMQITNEAI
jgi:hypothetical protein